MAPQETEVDRLRISVTSTIQRGTDLLADLGSLDARLMRLLPVLQGMPASERTHFVARLCGYDAALPDRLRELIEGLADLVGGLTTTDGGAVWRRHHLERLAAGENEEAA